MILCSCKGEETGTVAVSDEFKLEFLNEILSDTTDLKILLSKEQLISNLDCGFMPPPYLPIDPQNTRKSISHTKFISDTLNIQDTIFVRQQGIDNAKLDLNKLAEYGSKIFDLKGLVEKNVPHNSILDKVDSLNVGTESYRFLKFSVPIFNKERNLAYIRLSHGSGGETLILEKVNEKWTKKYAFDIWVE